MWPVPALLRRGVFIMSIKIKKGYREKVYHKYDGHCAYCGVSFKIENMQVDHFIPIRRHIPIAEQEYKNMPIGTSELKNLMPSCRSCNVSKSSWNMEQWRESIQHKIVQLNRDINEYRTAKRFGLIKETGIEIIFYFE